MNDTGRALVKLRGDKNMNLQLIVVVALAVIAAGGALFALRISFQRRSDRSNKVTIRDVRTNGDVAGRDINKK